MISQFITSSFNIAFGSVIAYWLLSALYTHGVPEESIFISCCIVLTILILCILPIYYVVCAIRWYRFERNLTVIIDESSLEIQYITSTSTKILSFQHVVAWERNSNARMGSLLLNTLEFDNGDIIMFSDMFSLDEYIMKKNKRKELGLPEIEILSTYRFYHYLKFIREQEAKNSQS